MPDPTNTATPNANHVRIVSQITIKILLLVIYIITPRTVISQATHYPTSADIVDVTKAPYFADSTGTLDATDAINQAMLDHNDSHAIIYLPEGTYRITNTVLWGSPAGCESGSTYTCHRYTVLAGAGRDVTTIQLDDNAVGYQDADNPKLLLWTQTSAAMSFENAVRNLTINTGSGNPGTNALGFEANNQGGIQNVRIKSEDRQGNIGLHMGTGDQAGPCHIKNLEVEGFDIGIYTFANQNSIYFEHINLLQQNEYGFYNRQQMVSIKDLTSTNEVPAIYNHSDGGSMVTLINSTLTGIGSANEEIAFRNNNRREIFIRNVQTTGYNYALQQLQNGFSLELLDDGYIDEYTTNGVTRICNNIERSLNLPIKETPMIAYDDTTDWVSIVDYGAEIDNGFQGKGSNQDDTQAIQDALNSGASTVLVPGPLAPFPQRFIAYDTITIPASVTHILGSKGLISGAVTFEILPGTDTLVIEDFAQLQNINHFSSRPVILKNLSIKVYSSMSDGSSGDLFIEDVVGGPYYFKNQDVWARQMNTELDSLNVTNDGGTLWVFGMKTEKKGTAIRTINGGKTEVLGALFYGTKVEESIPKPIFEVIESHFSISTFKELGYIGDAWDIKVREVRNGVTAEYEIGNVPIRADLFVCYPSSQPNLRPMVDAGPDQIIKLPLDSTYLEGYINDDAAPNSDCYTTNNWRQLTGGSTLLFDNINDQNTKISFSESGTYRLELTANDGQLSTSDTVTIYVYDHVISTADHNEDGSDSGTGADANIRGWSNYQKNYGGSTSFGPRNYNQFPAKSIFRIDVSHFATQAVKDARLELEIATNNTGIIEDWTYNIFGLLDGHPDELWVEGDLNGTIGNPSFITYENAPGFSASFGGAYDPATPGSAGVDHTQAIFLGTIDTRKNIREKVSFSSDALQEFVNQDTSGAVTFLMTRASFALNTIVFASKEHETFAPPSLYLDHCETAATVYLDETASGTLAGDTWANAYTSLSEIFDSPCFREIDTVLVATGTYIPDVQNSNYSLRIDHPLTIIGGYGSGGGARDVTQHPTIISGNINDPTSDEDNLIEIFRILGPDGLLALDGIVIER